MKNFRLLFTALVTALCLCSTLAPAAGAQGLGERRAIKEYQDKKFPELKKKLDDAAGFEVKLTVDWDKLAVPGQAENYLNDAYISDIFFYPLIDALKSISKDEMGKQALKSKLKEVVMTFDPDTAPATNYEDGWPFKDGVLKINYQPGTNSSGRDSADYKERVQALTKNLEAGL